MAIFVDLEEEYIRPHQDGHPKPLTATTGHGAGSGSGGMGNRDGREEAHEPIVVEDAKQTSMAKALGCYPIVISVASHLDLNSLDSLSRTSRQIRYNLLQYRAILLASTLHCSNEDLPIDPDDTLRFRARAGNWFYMEDAARTNYNGKSGQCARDMVSGCRRCGTVVCRNCAIKPPAPIVMRDRHRRLCTACVKAPIGGLVKPHLWPNVRIDSEDMQRVICKCGSEGLWLCQPCGRTIRADDDDYKGIWRWRNQYTDVLGGLGTGIGEGDRGVICGRGAECCAAREREQETDCDAEDAREADQQAATPLSHVSSTASSSSSPSLFSSAASVSSQSSTTGSTGLPGGVLERRTPSPAMKVGYVRHEVEGIGGVMKKIVVRMVKVGACVPEWDDERQKRAVLERELQERRRSWCGWCWRVIPSKKDYEMDRHGHGQEGEASSASSASSASKGKERSLQ